MCYNESDFYLYHSKEYHMHHIDTGIKENFFQWRGRLNRARYINRTLVLIAAGTSLYMLMVALFAATGGEEDTFLVIYAMSMLLCLPITIASYMLMIRRLHDIGLSGFFLLLSFIPIVSLGFFIYILVKKGTEGDNAYGSDPLGATDGGSPCAENAPAANGNPYARSGSNAPGGNAPVDLRKD